ncbi:MAG: GNAT family N-acetyltransferase [Clostridia bacterium]|nr:GNAT family N-acetyltransferase [Clostridia bacterium]
MDVNYLGIDRVMKRGTGEVLEERDGAILVKDLVSGAYLLSCSDKELGTSLLDRYADKCGLMMTTDCDLGISFYERYGFSEKLECFQFAYYGEAPSTDDTLFVRCADAGDLPMLTETYHLISPAELRLVVERGSLLLGYRDGRPVGFIGEHLEGSMGLLFVFPEFRRRGFAAELEKIYIGKTIERGFIPFGQVEKDNAASLRLQEKLGMTRSDSLICWMWK